MKQLRIFFIILAAITASAVALSSCISDGLTSSPSHTLTFSSDTVTFDTVFTDVGTPTARLLVYNRAKKGVNISSIRFAREDSYFSMNVDGQNGRDFKDIEILGKDSIYIFIECLIPPTQSHEPFLVEDKLTFVTNGVTQEVQVEAYGQNVTRLKAVTLDRDTRLTAEQPYVVFDSLVVAPGAHLTIDPGVKLLFHDKAELIVRGAIEAIGEPGKLIDMRGDRLDNVLPDVSYDIMAGQWAGMRITPESFGNRLEYVNMRSTEYGLSVDSCGITDRSKLLLRNSWLHNSQGSVLSSAYARVDAYGVCFSESPLAVVSLKGGSHTFKQCTIANNYLFAAVTEPLLSLYHLFPDDLTGGNTNTLMDASFENCIIYGLGSDINCGDLTDSSVFLRNVLMKSSGSDDEHFVSCIWDADPMFYTVRDDYYFNYRLKPDSPAIGTGNPAYVGELTLYDIDGLNRLAAGNPDLGAYVFVPAKDDSKQ